MPSTYCLYMSNNGSILMNLHSLKKPAEVFCVCKFKITNSTVYKIPYLEKEKTKICNSAVVSIETVKTNDSVGSNAT